MRIPSTSNTMPNAPGQQGTQGGKSAYKPSGRRPSMPNFNLGDELYLWILIGAEVGAMAYLRKVTRRHHGG